MAITAIVAPAKLTFENFSLNRTDPIMIENKTIQMLFNPKTTELSNLLLFKANIKKYNEQKLAIPSIVPPISSAIDMLFDIDFGLIRMKANPKIRAVRKTTAENNRLMLFGTWNDCAYFTSESVIPDPRKMAIGKIISLMFFALSTVR
jgi:hypothetical protein